MRMRALGFGEVLDEVFRFYRRNFWLLVLLSLTCLLIPLSLWILVRWAVAIPVLLNERAGPVAALSRSWHLTRGSWWRTFGILVVAILIEYVASDIVTVIGLPIAALVPFIP